MEPKTRKIILWGLSGAALLGMLLFGAYVYVLGRIKGKLEEQFIALSASGYLVKYDSIMVDSKKNEVIIHRLSIKRTLDSALCGSTDFITAKCIRASGFRLLPLLFKRHLSFASIAVDSPKMMIHKNFFSRSNPASTERKEFAIKIDRLSLPGLLFEFMDSTICVPEFRYRSNNEVNDFVLAFYKDRDAYFNISKFLADSIRLDFRDELYTFKVFQLRVDQTEKTFQLDTLQIIPHYPKIAFGKKAGREVDRFEGTIPYVNLYGFTISQRDSINVTVAKLTTQFFLKAFRDKRLPFKNPYKRLPVDALTRLHVGLKIDSVVVNKSYVEYEEFAQDADSAGRIFFDNLYASIKNIDNRSSARSGEATLVAEGLLMGDGKLHVSGTCPFDPAKDYEINGTLAGMDLRELNEMLEPQLKTRIESGTLNSLAFNFHYDNNASLGQLQLNYNDLRVATFRNENRVMKKVRKKQKKGEQVDEQDELKKKSSLKTFVVNTFILKKDLDGKDPKEKRTGTISFQRDKHKAIFNYWIKSLLSGLKSAFNIDKLQDNKITKLITRKPKD
jgi:hypothetical protein